MKIFDFGVKTLRNPKNWVRKRWDVKKCSKNACFWTDDEKNDIFPPFFSTLPAVLQVLGLCIHHIMALPTFDYSKASIPALRMAFSSIFLTNKSKSETIMILPIIGESWEFCLGFPRGWLGPLRDWLERFRGGITAKDAKK